MPHGNHTIPAEDAEEAIKLVRKNAEEWHINPKDVGIMGFSAGGHLASAVSTHAPADARPDFSILFYPVISMDEKITHRGSVHGFLGEGRNDASLVEEFSSDRAVKSKITPPAIIFTSNDDGAVPPVTNAIAYYSAMQRAGNECTLHVYASGGHGWGFRENFRHHRQMVTDLIHWLAERK
jgi:acetyl esterase/lipase